MGTVFSVTPSGTETVLHSFGGSGDGESRMRASSTSRARSTARPLRGCILQGSDGCGTVFSITPSGKETVLHSFAAGPDGNSRKPALSTSRARFTARPIMGHKRPRNRLLDHAVRHGNRAPQLRRLGRRRSPVCGPHQRQGHALWHDLRGGAYSDGTVFSITPSGTETVLYSFKGGGSGDGESPRAGLVKVKGALYGTTGGGGTGCDGSYGCGTVYSLSRF